MKYWWRGCRPGRASRRCAGAVDLFVEDGHEAAQYFGERGSLVRVPLQAPLSQALVLGVGCGREVGEECVGLQHPGCPHVGLLPSVERPHEHTERVDVGPGGDLQGRWAEQAGVITLGRHPPCEEGPKGLWQ